MSRPIEKVIAFITRRTDDSHELLLFEHANAGIQIPAGTVEEGETLEAAALREAYEETGLSELTLCAYLGDTDITLPGEQRMVAMPTRVYARPDATSSDWAYLPRGITVHQNDKRAGGFVQITYQEYDRLPDPQYVSLSIIGWVPERTLANRVMRHFFHLTCEGVTAARWTVTTDNHRFTLFWAPLALLPPIIPPQDKWLAILLSRFQQSEDN